MDKTYNIPLRHESGTYSFIDLITDNDKNLVLEYQKYGDIIEYEHPDNGNNIILYEIGKEDFEKSLKAVYNEKGELKTLSVNARNNDRLLYIHYENGEEAQQKILEFAADNADIIIKKISAFKGVVSRLFIEYFDDGEYFDFHAKLGTPEQQKEIIKKYGKESEDWAGDYASENIYGDNDRFGIMIRCADTEENCNYFNLAVDLMAERIKEKSFTNLNKSDDFKFIAEEYD